MKITKLRTYTNIIATSIGIAFVILTYYLKSVATLLLSIEVILLPSVYIISNLHIEDYLIQKYNFIINKITKNTYEMDEKFQRLILENKKLKYR
jgi:hypothetical protein